MFKHSLDPNLQSFGKSRNKLQSIFATRTLKRSKLKDFIGKSYVLIRSEKYEQFLQQLGATEEIYKSAARARPKVTLKGEDNGFALVISFSDFPKQIVKFKDGEIIQRELQGGTIVKSSFEIKGNMVTEVQEWNDKRVVISRIFEHNELTVCMEVDEVKCYRHYNKLQDEHDTVSETSPENSQVIKETESVSASPTNERIIAISNSDYEINLCL